MVSPDGVAPSRMVSISASVNLPLHHKVQKFSSGTGSPRWSRKRGVKRLCLCERGNITSPQCTSVSESVLPSCTRDYRFHCDSVFGLPPRRSKWSRQQQFSSLWWERRDGDGDRSTQLYAAGLSRDARQRQRQSQWAQVDQTELDLTWLWTRSHNRLFHYHHQSITIIDRRILVQTLQNRMWANAQPDGRPAEHRWCLCSTPQSLADAHY